MPKESTLLDRVAAALPSKGPAPLMSRLPPEVAAELMTVRDAWRKGHPKIGRATKTSLGRILADHLRSQGVAVSYTTVVRWLEEK